MWWVRRWLGWTPAGPVGSLGCQFKKFSRRLQRDRRFPSKGDNNNNVDQIINKTDLLNLL